MFDSFDSQYFAQAYCSLDFIDLDETWIKIKDKESQNCQQVYKEGQLIIVREDKVYAQIK